MFTPIQCFSSYNISLLNIFKEELCQQPVAIFTAVQFIAMMFVHIVAMCVLYTKLNKMFNPNWTSMKIRDKNRVKRIAGRQPTRQVWT